MRLHKISVQASLGNEIITQRIGLFTEEETDDAIISAWKEAFVQLKRRGMFDWKKGMDFESIVSRGFDFRVHSNKTE